MRARGRRGERARAEDEPSPFAARLDAAEEQLAADASVPLGRVDHEPVEVRDVRIRGVARDEQNAHEPAVALGGQQDVVLRVESGRVRRRIGPNDRADGGFVLIGDDAFDEGPGGDEAVGPRAPVDDVSRHAHILPGTGTPRTPSTSASWTETTWSAARRARRVVSSFSCAIGCVWYR